MTHDYRAVPDPWVSGSRPSAACWIGRPRVIPITSPGLSRARRCAGPGASSNERVNRIAASLIALGVEPGEHVGIWSMNVPEWVVDPVRRRADRRRAGQRQPGVSGPRAEGRAGDGRRGDAGRRLVRSRARTSWRWSRPSAPRWPRRDSATGPRRGFPLEAADRAGRPARPRLVDLVRAGRQRPGVSRRARRPVRAVQATDVHNMQFTSGTTGLPKGAMLTHRNVLMNAFYTGERLRYSAADRVCVPVPFYHCFGCVLGTMACVVHGSAMVVPAPSFDARARRSRRSPPSAARRSTACRRCSWPSSSIPISPAST